MKSGFNETGVQLTHYMSTGDPGISPAAQPPVTIAVPTASAQYKTDYSKIFPKNIVFGLGGIQLIIAVIVITSQILTISWHYDPIAFVVTGIWCGVFFGLSGCFALWAGFRPSLRSIRTCMVFSIIAGCLCIPLIVIDSISMQDDAAPFGHYLWPCRGRREYYDTDMAVYSSTQVVIGLAQACIAIGCATMAGKVACCKQKEAETIDYSPDAASNANVQHSHMGQLMGPDGFGTIPIKQSKQAFHLEPCPCQCQPNNKGKSGKKANSSSSI